MLKTIAVIPARNEAPTIGPIVATIKNSGAVSKIIVLIDAETTDRTSDCAELAGAHKILTPGVSGKGELMSVGVEAANIYGCDRILFCDADYEDLTREHVRQVVMPGKNTQGMVLGVPDYPGEGAVPARVINSWHAVTGFRSVPLGLLLHHQLYGYLAEAQINRLIMTNHRPVYIERCIGLNSPYIWDEIRHAEYIRDRQRGRLLGIL